MAKPAAELYENIYQDNFSFGRNWRSFLKLLTEERLTNARNSLTEFTGLDSFAGKTFIDVGCGSAIFSLSACQLGADKVVSVDVDRSSVRCAEFLKEKYAIDDSRWEIIPGSALDPDFIGSLGQFDIVYSWGVLHHSGDMWRALQNVSRMTRPGGLFYTAIYNHKKTFPTSEDWLKVKRFYSGRGALVRRPMEVAFIMALTGSLICRRKNPIRHIFGYKNRRGMSFYRDVVDWLGGYPYEFASVEEITSSQEKLGFETCRVAAAPTTGCSQFLFRKK
jgi:2-polyprenyl-6-hydroxyphenyl methylase/3-demethylubiquinone-9 3-methyltransferase